MFRASFFTAWPTQCEVCHGWGRARICAPCVTRFAAPASRCACCGLRLAESAPRCGACLREPPAFEATTCVADYAFPWDRLISAFKFQSRVELAVALSGQLVNAVQRSPRPRPELVLPVPLHGQRLAERGYNQAWEIGRRAARQLRIASSAGLLYRAVPGPRQSESTRAQRLGNLRAAFTVDARRRGELAGRRVALVDDVMTTGATAHAAAEAVKRAGAASVDVWVLARTAD